jgi:hypothetical protein
LSRIQKSYEPDNPLHDLRYLADHPVKVELTGDVQWSVLERCEGLFQLLSKAGRTIRSPKSRDKAEVLLDLFYQIQTDKAGNDHLSKAALRLIGIVRKSSKIRHTSPISAKRQHAKR